MSSFRIFDATSEHEGTETRVNKKYFNAAVSKKLNQRIIF